MAWYFNPPRPAAYPRLVSPDGTIHHMPRRYRCEISGQFLLDVSGNWSWSEDLDAWMLEQDGYEYVSNAQIGADTTTIGSGDVTQDGDFDNTTDPLTIADFAGRYTMGSYWQGLTIQIESEKLRISSYAWPSATFERGVDGTTPAAHQDGKTIWILLPSDSQTLRQQLLVRGQYDNQEAYLSDTLILLDWQNPLIPPEGSGLWVYGSQRWTLASGFGVIPRVRLYVGLTKGAQFNFYILLAYHVGADYPVAVKDYTELWPIHAAYDAIPGQPPGDWVPPFSRLKPCDAMALETPETLRQDKGLHTAYIEPVWL